MTTDRSDQSVNFQWDDHVRARVVRRAQEIRRTRRNAFGMTGGLLALVAVAVLAASLARGGPSSERVATTAPDPNAALGQLLPTPSSVTAVLPQLHVEAVSGGRAYAVVTPAEKVGAQGAELGVTRQWVTGTGSVQLQPGQPFPDEVTTVVSTILRFDTAVDAQGWTRQSTARAVSPAYLRVDGPLPGDLTVLRGSEALGGLQYLAFFTDGSTAFSLLMVAGGEGDHDGEFVHLVQDWTRQVAAASTPPITGPANASGGGVPATSTP
ncbi:MAG: hypothetical protein M3256_23695 [Actinomycetota bacterium]|nr:hypothetical protein [Actinomycetota bacterium]